MLTHTTTLRLPPEVVAVLRRRAHVLSLERGTDCRWTDLARDAIMAAAAAVQQEKEVANER